MEFGTSPPFNFSWGVLWLLRLGNELPERIKMLEIACITDIHNGPDRGSKNGAAAARLFEEFSNWVEASRLEVVIDLGDRISDVDRSTDTELAREVASWFRKLDAECYHLLGNHDLEELTLEENEEILGCNLRSRSLDLQGFHLVLWNLGSKLSQEKGFFLEEEALSWLKDDLDSTNLPSIIFTHVPLDNGSMKGNFYFDKSYPHHAHYSELQGEEIREVLECSGKVILCLNGHTHWNAYHCIDGIHYVTIPSLTETFPTYPSASESWTKLTIAKEIHVQVYGKLPIQYHLPIRSLNSGHWLNVDKAYAPQVATPK